MSFSVRMQGYLYEIVVTWSMFAIYLFLSTYLMYKWTSGFRCQAALFGIENIFFFYALWSKWIHGVRRAEISQSMYVFIERETESSGYKGKWRILGNANHATPHLLNKFNSTVNCVNIMDSGCLITHWCCLNFFSLDWKH